MKHAPWCNCHDMEVELVVDCVCGAYDDVNRLRDEVFNQRDEIERLNRLLESANDRLDKAGLSLNGDLLSGGPK